jgi:hypothetical protein
LLLASAVAPAAANAQDDGRERGWRSDAERSERASQRENARDVRSQQRAERGAQPQERAAESADRPERTDRGDRIERQADRTPRLDQSSDLDRAMHSDRMQGADRPARAELPVRTERANRDEHPVQQVQTPVTVQRGDGGADNLVGGSRNVPRDNASGRHNDHHDRDWKHDWRKDNRYDWWHYRSRYGSLYRLGRYSDPYGWGYRRWSAGYGLWPGYYGSSFWLNDPWMYRLPPVYGPYRWVRYYDDALLVNIYTGHVVDTVYNFFW